MYSICPPGSEQPYPWAMRWHADEHETAFPGVLGMPSTATAHADGSIFDSYVETILPAACVYVVWWVLHTAWLLLHGGGMYKSNFV
jgi:hypothetical protein